MGSIGFKEILVVLIVALLIFGAKRLPELGSSLGKAIRSFHKGIKGDGKKDDDDNDNNNL